MNSGELYHCIIGACVELRVQDTHIPHPSTRLWHLAPAPFLLMLTPGGNGSGSSNGALATRM